MKIRERLALTSKVTEDEHFEIYAGLREEIVLHGPMNYAKTLKLRFRVGDLDLPYRRKTHTSGRGEDEDAQMCPCGEAIESRTDIVGECVVYEEERDVLKMRKIESGMEKFSTLDSSKKAIAVLVDGGHRRRNRKGIK